MEWEPHFVGVRHDCPTYGGVKQVYALRCVLAACGWDTVRRVCRHPEVETLNAHREVGTHRTPKLLGV